MKQQETMKEVFNEIQDLYRQAEKMSGNDISFKCGALDALCDVLDIFHQKFGFEVDDD